MKALDNILIQYAIAFGFNCLPSLRIIHHHILALYKKLPICSNSKLYGKNKYQQILVIFKRVIFAQS